MDICRENSVSEVFCSQLHQHHNYYNNRFIIIIVITIIIIFIFNIELLLYTVKLCNAINIMKLIFDNAH